LSVRTISRAAAHPSELQNNLGDQQWNRPAQPHIGKGAVRGGLEAPVFPQALKPVPNDKKQGFRRTTEVVLLASGPVLPRQGVISAAGLDLVTIFGPDFYLAEGAVAFGISGGVADVVLAAQFAGDLVEGIF
jgi:hypothetical protein